ncbi:MAG: glycosyltransferase family A protein [Arenicellales bacterium]
MTDARIMPAYLLSTRWLRSFRDYLDRRMAHLEAEIPQELLAACRAFLTNPLKLWPAIRWFLRASPAHHPAPETGITLDMFQEEPLRARQEDMNERRELKASIDALRASFDHYQRQPGAALARRIRRTTVSRRNVLRVPALAIRYLLSPESPRDRRRRSINIDITVNSSHRDSFPEIGVIAPPWLSRMFSFENVDPPRRALESPSVIIFCCGLDDCSDDALRPWLESGTGTEPRRIFWHYGGRLTGRQIEVARRCDHVFAAHPSLKSELESELSTPVDHLAPAVQPRLHNPIGRAKRPGELDRFDKEYGRGVPTPWRKLILTALGLAEGEAGGQEDSVGPASDWMDREMSLAAKMYVETRHILSCETMRRRMEAFGRACGLPVKPLQEPSISVLIATKRPEKIGRVFQVVSGQTYQNLELILVLHGDGFDEREIGRKFDDFGLRGRYLRAPSAWSLGECLRYGCEHTNGSVITKMDDDNMYGPGYLADMAMMLDCSEAVVVGKRRTFTYLEDSGAMKIHRGPEYDYTTGALSGATITFKRELLDEIGWRALQDGEDVAFCADCFNAGIPVLSGSRFNFVTVRSANGDHTSEVSEEQYKRRFRDLPAAARPADVLL